MAKDTKADQKKSVTPQLGKLSERWESNGAGPQTVSSGKGDPGGVSYGTYQFSSQTTDSKGKVRKGGTVKEFLNSVEGKTWQAEFKHEPGDPEFSKTWKDIAKRDSEAFAKAQYDFTKRTHYDPFEAQVQRESGLDLSNRSNTLRQVLWSTGVQHRGTTADIFAKAIASVKASTGKTVSELEDKVIIEAVYAERFRTTKDGAFARFKHADKALHKGLENRARDEPRAALSMLRDETMSKGASMKASPEEADAAKRAIGHGGDKSKRGDKPASDRTKASPEDSNAAKENIDEGRETAKKKEKQNNKKGNVPDDERGPGLRK